MTVTARRLRTRERLASAAREVMAEHGIGVGVEQICEAAGFTRGAFYSNFSDRSELIEAMLLPRVELMAERIAELGGEQYAADDLAELVQRFLDVANVDREFFLLIDELWLAAARDPEANAPALEPVLSMLERVRDALTSALASRGLRFTIDADDALRTLSTLHREGLRQALVTGNDADFGRRVLPAVLVGLTEQA